MPEIPALPKIPAVDIPQIPALDSQLSIPGTLGYAEVDENGNEVGAVGGFNAFDLQVPGFAVTFLLIGMLMGVSLALIDEHDWGTLERLRSASAPLWTTLTGKLLARFVVGFIQMIVLLAAGWALFGISLGHAPAALLMPASAIAFAGAAFGLIVAGIGRTRDAGPAGRRDCDHDDGGNRRMLVANRLRTDVDAKFGARAAHHLGDARVQRFDDPSSHGVECAGSDCRKFWIRDHLHDFRRRNRAPPFRIITLAGGICQLKIFAIESRISFKRSLVLFLACWRRYSSARALRPPDSRA